MEKIDLSLRGKKVRLLPYDEQYIDYIYNQIVNRIIEGFEKCKITEKRNLYKFLQKINIKFVAKDVNSDRLKAFFMAYNYNKIDDYLYISVILDGSKEELIEAIQIFINYIFVCFPIRKIYSEVCRKNKDKLIILDKIGFKQEAMLEKDIFFDGAYEDKLILSLYREDYNRCE